MTTQWEYLVCTSIDRGKDERSWVFRVCGTKINTTLDVLGVKGYELSAITPDGERYIFKRPK